MFCGKCGENVDDNTKFCPKCGNLISGNDRATQVKPEAQKYKDLVNGNNKNKTVGMIVVAIIGLVVISGAFWLFGGRSYKKTIKEYVNAQFNYSQDSIKKVVKLFPEGMWEQVVEQGINEGEFESEGEAIEFLEEQLKEANETLEEYYGEDFKYSYKITEEKDLSKKDIHEIEEDWEDMDVKLEKEIKEGKEITIKVEVKLADGENAVDNELDLQLVKVGRSWCLADFDF